MYKITIQEVKETDYTAKEYQKIADTGGEDGKSKYGYVETTATRKIEVTVLEQMVDGVDIQKVIKAINNID